MTKSVAADAGIAGNLLRLHLVGHVTIVVRSPLEEPCASVPVRPPRDQSQVDRLPVDADVGLVHKAVHDRQHPVGVDIFEAFQEVLVPDKLRLELTCVAELAGVHVRDGVQGHRWVHLGGEEPGRGQVVLQRVRQVVRVGEVEVGRQVNALEHLQVSLLIAVSLPHSVVRDIDHGGVLYFVNRVVPYQPHLAPLGDEDDIVTLKKTNETSKTEG